MFAGHERRAAAEDGGVWGEGEGKGCSEGIIIYRIMGLKYAG